MLFSSQDVQLLTSLCKGVICNHLVIFLAIVTMGNFKTNTDTSTPLGETEFLFFVK